MESHILSLAVPSWPWLTLAWVSILMTYGFWDNAAVLIRYQARTLHSHDLLTH